MKRLLIVLLVLSLFMPVVAHADDAEFYAVLYPMGTDGYAIFNIVKTPEKIYVGGVQTDVGFEGRPYTVDDGIISFQIDDAVYKAQIADDKMFYQVLPEGPTIALNRVAPYDPSLTSADDTFKIPEKKNSKGKLLHQGMYIAGEDFEPGPYRIELAYPDSFSFIDIYKNKEKVTELIGYFKEYYLSSESNNSVIGRVDLEAGYVLSTGTTILLIPYEGIK